MAKPVKKRRSVVLGTTTVYSGREISIVDLKERFWSKVYKEGKCRVWVCATHGGGYGAFGIGEKQLTATHVAWFLHYGKWPTKFLLHTCDNPPCVRWDHLFEGTNKDNMADMVAKGRSCRGERHGGCKLTDLQVRCIRYLYKSVDSTRGAQAYIAKQFGVSPSLVFQIVHKQVRAWL